MAAPNMTAIPARVLSRQGAATILVLILVAAAGCIDRDPVGTEDQVDASVSYETIDAGKTSGVREMTRRGERGVGPARQESFARRACEP